MSKLLLAREQATTPCVGSACRDRTFSVDSSRSAPPSAGAGHDFSRIRVNAESPVRVARQDDGGTDASIDPAPPQSSAPSAANVVADPVAGVSPAPQASSSCSAPNMSVPPAAVSTQASQGTSSSSASAPNMSMPDGSTATGGASHSVIPSISTGLNDALSVGLSACSTLPGPVGTACNVAGMADSATQGPSATTPHHDVERAAQVGSLGLGATSLLSTIGATGALGETAAVVAEFAGGLANPAGEALAAGMGTYHAINYIGHDLPLQMAQGGVENNPGQFGPDPVDQMFSGGQGY